MEYDRVDSFSFDFKPNRIWFFNVATIILHSTLMEIEIDYSEWKKFICISEGNPSMKVIFIEVNEI